MVENTLSDPFDAGAFDALVEAFKELCEMIREYADTIAGYFEMYTKAEDDFPPERETEETVYILPRLPIRRAPPAKVKRWRAAVFGHYLGEREIRVKGGETA